MGVATDFAGDEAGQGRDALGLVEYRTELGLKHHVGQALVEAFELLLLVLLEEELGVGKARTHDLLVAGDDLRRVLGLDVGHCDEARQQLAVRIEQAEVLLVVLHGADQRLLRHFEETFLERADQRHRPFDQGGDFIQQRWRHDSRALLGGGQFVDAAADDLAALGEVGQHIGAAQVFGVVRRAADAHFAVGMEAMATGHAIGLLREDFAVDHSVAEQHHQPLGRAHELVAPGGPAHALGNRQVVQRVLHDGRQQLHRWLAGDVLGEAQFRAAAVNLGDIHPALAGEAQGGLGRVAVGIEGGLQGRAVEVHAAVGLLFFELLDQHCQAARRGVYAAGGVAQAGGLQTFLDAFEEGLTEAFQGFGWQLFGAQFDQEILCTHACASSLASTSSRSSGVAMGKPSLARACR